MHINKEAEIEGWNEKNFGVEKDLENDYLKREWAKF